MDYFKISLGIVQTLIGLVFLSNIASDIQMGFGLVFVFMGLSNMFFK